MTEAFTSLSTDIACPITGELCPERQGIVDAYSMDDETRVTLGIMMSIDDPNHPRHDQRKMHMNLALHRWQVEERGCGGASNGECGIKDMDAKRISFLGKLASKFSRKQGI